MALLRNLNNFLKHDINLEPVIKVLTNPEAVRKSKQFPFRFFSAYRAIQEEGYLTGEKVNILMDALNTAIEFSIQNIPKIPGRSLILVDASGSMIWNTISKSSKVSPADISRLFGAISSKICESSDFVLFASTFKQVNFSSTSEILDRMEKTWSIRVGHSTDAHLPMNYVREKKIKYDRIFLFSDMQCYDSNRPRDSSFAEAFLSYQREVFPAFLYSIDLVGYGTAQIPQDSKNVSLLAGWSERIFDFIQAFESDRKTMVLTVENFGKEKLEMD